MCSLTVLCAGRKRGQMYGYCREEEEVEEEAHGRTYYKAVRGEEEGEDVCV